MGTLPVELEAELVKISKLGPIEEARVESWEQRLELLDGIDLKLGAALLPLLLADLGRLLIGPKLPKQDQNSNILQRINAEVIGKLADACR